MKRCINQSVAVAQPEAYITKGKQRLKQHNNNTVYLKDGDEFQIELFNPTNDKISARITIDGNSIGGNIIIKPGQRAFLERFVNKPNKFLFETYEVNGKSQEVRDAISNNGVVLVEFCRKRQPMLPLYGNGTVTTTYISNVRTTTEPIRRVFDDGNIFHNVTYDALRGNYGTGTGSNATFTTSNFIDPRLNGTITTTSMDMLGDNAELDFAPETAPKPKTRTKSLSKMETGRIETGSSSSQTFTNDYDSYEMFATWTTKWQILPESRKEITVDELQVFCTECGAKRKKDSFKFCPHCGTKF